VDVLLATDCDVVWIRAAAAAVVGCCRSAAAWSSATASRRRRPTAPVHRYVRLISLSSISLIMSVNLNILCPVCINLCCSWPSFTYTVVQWWTCWLNTLVELSTVVDLDDLSWLFSAQQQQQQQQQQQMQANNQFQLRHLLQVEPSLYIFRSTLLSRPNKVDLKCPYVRPSTKSFLDFNKTWRVDRGRWVMHDGMQYDLI